MSVSSEEQAKFTPIIDSILAASDLTIISEKRIRKGLQAAVEYDLTEKKDALKGLIMARFDKAIAEREAPPQTNGHASTNEASSESPANNSQSPPPSSKVKKHKRELDVEDETSEAVTSPSPKKKRKTDEDADAAYAARLQALENSRARATRGGGAKPSKPVKKKTPKKKSAGRLKAEDDSDLDGSGSEVKERKVNRNTGFHKELVLSSSLSALLGNETKLSRPQTVKKIWEHIRAHDLQDANDKRMIRCDEPMRAVFKQDKIHMFTMNKVLNQNLYAVDE